MTFRLEFQGLHHGFGIAVRGAPFVCYRQSGVDASKVQLAVRRRQGFVGTPLSQQGSDISKLRVDALSKFRELLIVQALATGFLVGLKHRMNPATCQLVHLLIAERVHGALLVVLPTLVQPLARPFEHSVNPGGLGAKAPLGQFRIAGPEVGQNLPLALREGIAQMRRDEAPEAESAATAAAEEVFTDGFHGRLQHRAV